MAVSKWLFIAFCVVLIGILGTAYINNGKTVMKPYDRSAVR